MPPALRSRRAVLAGVSRPLPSPQRTSSQAECQRPSGVIPGAPACAIASEKLGSRAKPPPMTIGSPAVCDPNDSPIVRPGAAALGGDAPTVAMSRRQALPRLDNPLLIKRLADQWLASV